jgi:hypothetical protein
MHRTMPLECAGMAIIALSLIQSGLFSEDGETRVVTLNPVEIQFNGLIIQVQSVFRIAEGSGQIQVERRIVSTTDPLAEVTVDEYITACYGTTEYPGDLSGVRLKLEGPSGSERIDYAYQCSQAEMIDVTTAAAVIPQIVILPLTLPIPAPISALTAW